MIVCWILLKVVINGFHLFSLIVADAESLKAYEFANPADRLPSCSVREGAVPNGALENCKRGKNSAISRLGDYRHDCGSLHLQQSSPQPLPFFRGEGSRRPLFIIAAQQRLWYLNNINFVRTVGILIKDQIKLILVYGTSLLTCWLLLKISLYILHLHSLQLRLHIIRINIKIRIQNNYSIAGSIIHFPGISFSTNNK